MSLHYVYSLPSNATLDITQYCRLYQFSCSQDAKEGSVAHTTLVVDDEAGALDFVGHRRIYMYEDLAAASNQVIYNGYIQREVVSRGPYRTGAGRIWTLDLADTNVLLNRRLMNGTDASRPAEDDIDRIVALETMTELNTFDDFLYVNLTAATTPMDAVDYRTQPALQYIDDCAQASGKNYFGWYREATGDNSLWYDFAASSNWQGTKRLSNVLSDVDNSTTFAVDMEHDAELDRDPSRVASGVMLPFDGVAVGSNTINGTVYVQNPTTTATFAAIDWLAPSVNVKTQAMAVARANRYLEDATEEDDLIHCSVKLPSANVNDFMAGMRFEAKFSHLPGYEDFTPFRCLSRTVTEISEDPTRAYRLDLELSPMPPETGYMMSFLIQRDITPTGPDIVPRGTDDGGATWSDPFTWLGGSYVRSVGNYPFDVAYLENGPSHAQWTWGGASGLNGTSRPTGLHLILTGATGPPEYLGDYPTTPGYTPVGGTSLWSPTVVAPDDGIMFCLLGGNHDGFSNDPDFVVTGPSGVVTLRQSKAMDESCPSGVCGFHPRECFVYKRVTTGESVEFTFTNTEGFGEWNSCVVFVPGADLEIAEFVHTGSGGSSLGWSW